MSHPSDRPSIALAIGFASVLMMSPGALSAQDALTIVNEEVGIGTENPVGPLHVQRTTFGAKDMMILENNGPTRILLDNTSSGTGWRINHANDGALRFAEQSDAGAAIEMLLNSSGDLAISGTLTSSGSLHVDDKVGIGTASPDADLHIFNNSTTAPDGNSEILMEVNGQPWRLRNLVANGIWAIRDENTVQAPFRIGPGSKNNLLQIGIASTNTLIPDQVTIDGELVVTGNCSEQDGACADYVFEPSYELRSLEEVEAFIAENGHLPNIPSAEEIEKNGVSVQRMQGRLLEKIEELTLYTLTQQQMIEELQTQLTALREDGAKQE